MSWLRQNATVILFNLVVITALLIGFEYLVRTKLSWNMTFEERRAASLQYMPSGFSAAVLVPGQTIYEFERGKKSKRVKYRINEYGYRGASFPIKNESEEIRIAVIGGSHVFDIYSYDYNQDFGFPQLIQNHFQAAGQNVRVINAGLPGNESRQYVPLLLFDLHRYQPHIVVFNSTWNDTKWISKASDSTHFLRSRPRAGRKNVFTTETNILDKVLGFSAVYRKVRDLYWRRRFGMDQDYNEGIITSPNTEIEEFDRGLEQFELNLTSAIHVSRVINAVPVLAIEERLVGRSNTPADQEKVDYFYVNVKSHAELVNLYEQCDAIIEDVSRRFGVQLIDVNKEINGDSRYFVDHVHTTPEGSRYIAQRYFELLRPLVDSLRINP